MDNETITFEDRLYVNPEVSTTEQGQFMDRFRNLQAQNQAQINQDTYNLGTPVSSNLGGLIGAEGRWNTQYQRPQVNAAVENLRQVNMQQALNTAMQNQQNVMANRLNQAKRAYYRAQHEANARDRNKASGSNGDKDYTKGNINVNGLKEGKGSGSIQGNAPETATVLTPNGVLGGSVDGKPDMGVYNPEGGQPLWSTNEGQSNTTQGEISFWDVNNPLAWLSGVLSLPGSLQQVKK